MAERMRGQLATGTGTDAGDRFRAPGDPAFDSLANTLQTARTGTRDERIDALTRVIEGQVIPRLISAMEPSEPCMQVATDGPPTDSREVVELTGLVMAYDVDAAFIFVEEMQAQGTSLDSIYLDLLAPTARRLGELWTADQCDFTQVTTGLWRLQRLMHDLSPTFQSQMDRRAHGRWALLVPVPGDQHSFGLFMVAEFFRRDGWNVRSGPMASLAELSRAVRSDWYSVAGISAGSETLIDVVAACVQAIRSASCNPAVKVMVGGPLFLDRPDLVALVGADATATDGQDAVRQAEALLATQQPRG